MTESHTCEGNPAESLVSSRGFLKAEDYTRHAEIDALSKQVLAGFTRGNVKAIAGVVADDFTFIDDRGVALRGADCLVSIEDMVSNPPPDRDSLSVESFRVSDVNRRVYGDTVIETMLYSDHVVVKRKDTSDRPFTRSFRLTNVWVRQNGAMKLASTQ